MVRKLMCHQVQVLQRLPNILESMIVPSEDEDLVFLTRLLQVSTLLIFSPLTCTHVMLMYCVTLWMHVGHNVWL